ncbi:MAG: DUF4125 family protein [Lachnospiraceae bacterium]|nr:DUF4125 family protein [Lachnospiraceae bacterium]
MNINEVLKEYDEIESTHDLERTEEYLISKIDEASNEKDTASQITLYNEIIGFYRETGAFQKSIDNCARLLGLLDGAGIKGSIEYATSLLNIANACRAAGLLKESLTYFNEVKRIYDETLEPDDFKYAPLYNNLALLFQEMGDHESATDTLKRALTLAKSMPGEDIKVAISHTNLAMSLLKNGQYDEAVYNLEEAFKIFDSKPEPDYHYGAALSAMAEARYMAGDYASSAKFYEKALAEVKKNTGYSKAYDITLANLHQAAQMARKAIQEKESTDGNAGADAHISGLDLAQSFYEECVRPMIHEHFSEYENDIAAGLCGEGSECFGFDDEFSTDHDFGAGCCLWLDDETYSKIGEELQIRYDSLPVMYKGYVRLDMKKGPKRAGVFRIKDWMRDITGLGGLPTSKEEWLYADESSLAKVINGRIFNDPRGIMTGIRKGLVGYYPGRVYYMKLCDALARFSQYGQYNYPRMLERGDRTTAVVCLGEFMQTAMRLAYVFAGKYAPYYKWLNRGVRDIDGFVYEKVSQIAADVYNEEKVHDAIDALASYFLKKLKDAGLSYADDDYLEHHTVKIMSMVSGNGLTHEELTDQIVRLEWENFDKVKNEGGRAYCQDDWTTFSIMRKSQYITWSDEMLRSLIEDFYAAEERGWNMITEKYGRMEESTAPEQWALIKDSFPPIDDEQKAIIESIVGIQVKMMEEFAAEYPMSASNARSIHTSEDTPDNTSYETYLRGEISTYSPKTLVLYGRFVAGLAGEGRNLARMIIENTALMYGYRSLDHMENSLSGKH